MQKIEIIDKGIYHINFTGNVGNEVNSTHLGIIFKQPGLDKMVFCIPLTSPKEKHFKSKDDFKKRNKRELKYFSWYYIKQTDSIAKLDQLKTISTYRIKNYYKNENGEHQILNDNEFLVLKNKTLKYIEKILK